MRPILVLSAVALHLFSVLLHVRAGPVNVLSEEETTYEVRQVYKDEYAVLYFNSSIDDIRTNWVFNLYSGGWRYAKRQFGPLNFGNEGGRLSGRFHTDAAEGWWVTSVNSQDQNIFMAISPNSVKSGNLYDKEGRPTQPKQDIIWDYNLKAMSQIIEEANNDVLGSPASDIWRRDGFYPIMVYDILLNLGSEYKKDADEWKSQMNQQRSESGTKKSSVAWMKDWWSPLYDKNGRTKLISRFFKLTAQNWPTEELKSANLKDDNPGPRRYIGKMNVGEFVHFMSGAAGKNLRSMAKCVLGFEKQDEDNFRKAQKDYPSIRYK